MAFQWLKLGQTHSALLALTHPLVCVCVSMRVWGISSAPLCQVSCMCVCQIRQDQLMAEYVCPPAGPSAGAGPEWSQ